MNITKRIMLYMLGLFAMSVGVNLSKLSGLGISPVSSIPYAMEFITKIRLGTISIAVYITFIALQALILGKDFKLSSCLQFFCTFLMGFFINFTSPDSVFLSMVPAPESYIYRLVLCVVSCILIGIGVYIYLQAKLPALPAEGLMLAITQKLAGKAEFHTVKVVVDITMVLISAGLSIIFLGSLKTVREGTIIASVLVGIVVGRCKKIHVSIQNSSKNKSTVVAKEL
jgi:uncharacterized membrane protein YczE